MTKVGYDVNGVFTYCNVKLDNVSPGDLYAMWIDELVYYYDGEIYWHCPKLHLAFRIEKPLKLFLQCGLIVLVYDGYIKVVDTKNIVEGSTCHTQRFQLNEELKSVEQEFQYYLLITDKGAYELHLGSSILVGVDYPPEPRIDFEQYGFHIRVDLLGYALYYKAENSYYYYYGYQLKDGFDCLANVDHIYMAGNHVNVIYKNEEQLYPLPPPSRVKSARKKVNNSLEPQLANQN